MQEYKEVQCAHQLLTFLHRQKTENICLFYNMYREHFSILAVPPIKVFQDKLVVVNREKAINFLKNKFQFHTRDEREKILNGIAEEMNEARNV